jgi:DNA-binding transcriptional LysR family regulator
LQVSLEIRHCRALVAIADEGGVARAAAALGMAQSTLSETLISLERVVGTRMVVRQRGVEARLTPAARILLPHARQIAAAAEAAVALVAAEAKILRVGAVESISSYLLPTAVRRLRSIYPEIQVQVTVGLCADLRSQVASGRLDVAMLLGGAGSVSTPDLVIRRLGTSRLRLVVRCGGPLAGKRLSLAELGHLGILVPDPYGPLNDLMESWLRASGARSRLISAGSLDAVKRGVLADGAVGLLAAYAVDHEIATGILAQADLEVTPPAVVLEAATATSSARSTELEILVGATSLRIHARPPTASNVTR